MAGSRLWGSLLMPCRNPGPFRESTVHSVLAQPDCFERLVADGASSDGSLQTLEPLASRLTTQST